MLPADEWAPKILECLAAGPLEMLALRQRVIGTSDPADLVKFGEIIEELMQEQRISIKNSRVIRCR